jgi:hypothetical protein
VKVASFIGEDVEDQGGNIEATANTFSQAES